MLGLTDPTAVSLVKLRRSAIRHDKGVARRQAASLRIKGRSAISSARRLPEDLIGLCERELVAVQIKDLIEANGPEVRLLRIARSTGTGKATGQPPISCPAPCARWRPGPQGPKSTTGRYLGDRATMIGAGAAPEAQAGDDLRLRRAGSLAQMAVPTMVAVGDGDLVTSSDHAREFHEKVVSFSYHEIGSCGHMAALNFPSRPFPAS